MPIIMLPTSHDLQNRGSLLMRDRKPFGSLLWAVLLVVAATFGFNGCGNVNDVAHPNNAPVANAGPDLGSVTSGTRVTLNGSASTDPNGNPLTYSWTFLSKPAGSAAVLANPTSVTPSFTVDRSGDYVVQLIVNDGAMNSAPDTRDHQHQQCRAGGQRRPRPRRQGPGIAYHPEWQCQHRWRR